MVAKDDQFPSIEFPLGSLQQALNARLSYLAPSLAEVARRDLERYYEILREELYRVSLSEAEACALCDILQGSWIEPFLARWLWADLEDALEDGVEAKWGFDGPALVERLRRMPWSRLMAIADAVERWQVLVTAEPTLAHGTSLRQVGLLRDGPIPLTRP